MSTMLDMVGAAILFGVLLLTVGRIQANINSTMYQNTYNMNVQSSAVFLARQLEFEVLKAGYGVTGAKMKIADSTCIAFLGALSFSGAADSVAYYTGAADSTSLNPHDFRFIRQARSGGTISQRLGMTDFRFSFYDTANVRMATPVTGATALAAIRAIGIKFRLESFEPVIDPVTGTANYYAVNWEKIIYPRNLGKPF